MKIVLSDEPHTEIEVADEISVEDLVRTLAEHPAVIAIAQDVGKSSYYRAYSPYNGVYEARVLRPIVDAYLEGGVDAAEDYIYDHMRDDPEVDYNETVINDLKTAFEFIADQVVENEEFADCHSDIVEGLEEALQETCIDAMVDKDESKVTNLFGSHDKIEITFGIDLHQLGFDDAHMYWARENFFHIDTLDPNDNFMRLFKMTNVNPAAFVDYVVANKGFDPRIPYIPEGKQEDEFAVKRANEYANRWQAFYDAASEGLVSRETRAKFPAGHGFDRYCDLLDIAARTVNNIDRPAAYSMDDLYLIINEATGGGIPAYTARYPINDLLTGQLEQPFFATGGQLGIHDFINGSGYFETCRTEILINPSVGRFLNLSVNGTYDMIGTAFDNEIRPAEGADWVHVLDDSWRTEPGVEGAYAEIWCDTRSGQTTYWLSTYDRKGNASGLYEDSEAFDTLGEAMKVGLNVTRRTKEELEAEADAEMAGPRM